MSMAGVMEVTMCNWCLLVYMAISCGVCCVVGFQEGWSGGKISFDFPQIFPSHMDRPGLRLGGFWGRRVFSGIDIPTGLYSYWLGI